MDRSLHSHYAAILDLSVATRILASRVISPNEVRRGHQLMSSSFQAFARMRCHLTPYFHIAMHIEQQMYRFGPIYGTWAWPYERNNGFLGRTNNNRRAGGEIECTMIRKWWRVFFVHDLISSSFSLSCITDSLPLTYHTLRQFQTILLLMQIHYDSFRNVSREEQGSGVEPLLNTLHVCKRKATQVCLTFAKVSVFLIHCPQII